MRSLVLPLVCGAIALAQTTPQAKTFVPSDDLNAQLPKWLRFNGEYRARVEVFGGGNFRAGNDDLYFLNRFRLNMSVLRPPPGCDFSSKGRMLGFSVRIRHPLRRRFRTRWTFGWPSWRLESPRRKHSVCASAGRNSYSASSGLSVMCSWLNTARTFDAIRASFRHGGYRLDAFAASVVNIRDGEFNRHVDGNDFHGFSAVFDNITPNATVEPYAFWRLGRGIDFKTWGVRLG